MWGDWGCNSPVCRHHHGISESCRHHHSISESCRHHHGISESCRHHHGISESCRHHHGISESCRHHHGISESCRHHHGIYYKKLDTITASIKKRCSPRTRMPTRMLMVQMSKHMDMQSRRTLFCNNSFEQSCTYFPCYQSAVWSGGVWSGECRECKVWSVECRVQSVECKV